MGGNHCMHPVMCTNSRKGRLVHSCSINDRSTSYLRFLPMKGLLNKEVYGKPACLPGASTSLLLYIYDPADWRLRRRPVFVCKVR